MTALGERFRWLGSLRRHLLRLRRDEQGATAIEYALILAAITAIIIAVAMSLGDKTRKLYEKVDTSFPSP